MNNDLIITRSRLRETAAGNEKIDLQTWKDLVKDDPDLSLEETVETSLEAGFSFKVSSPGMAVWTAYPLAKIQGVASLFVYRKGTIVAKNADEYIRVKAFEIAGKLKAGVLADKEWLVPLHREVPETNEVRQNFSEKVTGSKSWWRFW